MFYKPWTGPNRTAYHAADTLADIFEGRKRCRKAEDVLVPLTESGHLPCTVCGERLDAEYTAGGVTTTDTGRGRVRHRPASGTISGTHYYCGWTDLLGKVVELGRYFTAADIA